MRYPVVVSPLSAGAQYKGWCIANCELVRKTKRLRMDTKLSAAFALLLLLSATIEVSSKLEVIPQPENFKTIEVTADGEITSCSLWSRVKHVGDNNQTNSGQLVNLPYVHWEKATKKSREFHPLREIFYWYREEGLSFLHSVRHYCERSQEDDTIYDCGITIQRCSAKYAGTYRYSVYDFDSGSQVEQSVPLKARLDELSHCYMPEAENITAEFIASDNGLGPHSINVSWEYAAKPRGVQYCDFSRQWQIRSFNSTHPDQLEDGKEPSVFRDFEFLNTTTKRDTFFVFRINDSLRNNYFQFQIRNRKRDGNTGNLIARKYNSSVFTFKEQVPASLIKPQINDELYTVEVGGRLTLRCEATGSPTPIVLLLKGVFESTWKTRTQDHGVERAPRQERVFDPVTKEDAGLYVCLASNILVGPPGGKRTMTDWKTMRVKVTEVDRTDVSETVHCNSYAGSICSGFIRDSISVYIDGISIHGNYSTLLNRAASLITNIRGAYSAKSNTTTDLDLLTKCKDLAEGVACHTVFPYCSPQEGDDNPTPRPICKSTCDAFRAGGICESFINSQMPPDFYNSLMSSCDERINPAGSSPECIPVPLEPHQIETEEIHWCLRGNGRNYNNLKRRTESGLDCQNWQSQAPHRHPFTLSDYPELTNAAAYCRNPGGVGERPWCYTSSTHTRWEYCDIPKCEICTRYDQAFCSQLPGYGPSDDSMIFVDQLSRGPGAQHLMELEMTESYDKLINNETKWSPGCDLALKQLICHTTLPFCNGTNQVKAICSDHCQLLQVVELCSAKVYELLLKDNQLSMPDCSQSARGIIPVAGQNCMPATWSPAMGHHAYDDCYDTSDLGQSYNGSRELTQRGELCDSWSNPHLLFNASLYPELRGAENFCRNPGRLREKPWCFTSMNSWDYCNLPTNCTGNSSNSPRSPAPRHSSGNQNLYPVLFTVIGVVVVVVAIVSAVLIGRYMNRHSKLARTATPLPLSLQHTKKYPSDMKMIDNDNYVPLPNSKMATTIKKFQDLDRQMKKANIRYVREIGRGNFGVVFQGKVSNLHDDNDDDDTKAEEETLVAVKTLKDDCQEALEDFAREAKIMLQFDHPNIIKLYGVCTDDMPYYLVFEYMDQGDLANFLRKNASSEQRRLMSTSSRHRSRTDSTISDDPASLSVDQLMDMCKQIAKGMEYLAGKDHVHRDLACRNCLVKTCFDTGMTDSGYIIKIGDFGMSHDLYQRNYYRVQGQAVLPVRWMSPEAVIFGKFSTAGDVWSFGVVMWEIFSFAMQPYYGISNEEVTKFIRTGRHLEKPFYCPRNTYEIMKQCWSAEPSQRPDFGSLYCMLETHRMSVSSDESSLCSDTMSQTGSELDSDAFLEENSIDGVFVAMSGESQA